MVKSFLFDFAYGIFYSTSTMDFGTEEEMLKMIYCICPNFLDR